ncbi:MAG TPA: DegQ family serine endoprotease [Stellaceae bacterium]|nr:DegQ family serine endoprotease [Stellaceae bacterium]
MSSLLLPPRRSNAFAGIRVGVLAAGFGLAVALAPLALAETAAPGTSAIVQLPTLAPLVKKVFPAVVNVSVTMKPDAAEGPEANEGNDQGQNQMEPPGLQNSPFDQFLRRFFNQQQGQNGTGPVEPRPERMALGSGFIIDPSGYIVTNNHVVQDADKVTVIFQDGSKFPAKVVGRDPKIDLALLKIAAGHPLPYVSWGDSNAVQVGDWVLAVGNPFGLGGTVSSGIISARGRDIHAGPYDDFLQIDASINRGNSGGPTFNLEGQVIGINTAIYSPNGGSVGIGFAIPSSLAKPVIEQLREHGKVERGWLGVQIQTVTPDLAKSLGLAKPEGALVADVTTGSPAAKVGIKQGDVILTYEGHHLAKMRDLPLAVAETKVGANPKLTVWRDGHEMTLQPVIAEMPANLGQMASNEPAHPVQPQSASALGLRLAPLTPELRRALHVPEHVNGVVVEGVSNSSPLAERGIVPGDVIQAINQEPVNSPKEAIAKLEAARKGSSKNLLFLINRQGVNQFVALSLGANNKG